MVSGTSVHSLPVNGKMYMYLTGGFNCSNMLKLLLIPRLCCSIEMLENSAWISSAWTKSTRFLSACGDQDVRPVSVIDYGIYLGCDVTDHESKHI